MTRPAAFATSLTLALAGTVLVLAPHASEAQPRAAPRDGRRRLAQHVLQRAARPPRAERPEPTTHASRPKPPRTKGTITGQVVGPNGTPIPHALVTGIRFSDLGLPVDLTEEKRVVARTNGSGRFTLKQLREPYLVRVCSESRSGGGGGHRAKAQRGVRPGEQQAVHPVVRRTGRHPQQLDAAHPDVPPPAAAPVARPDHRAAAGRGRRHLQGRRRTGSST